MKREELHDRGPCLHHFTRLPADALIGAGGASLVGGTASQARITVLSRNGAASSMPYPGSASAFHRTLSAPTRARCCRSGRFSSRGRASVSAPAAPSTAEAGLSQASW